MSDSIAESDIFHFRSLTFRRYGALPRPEQAQDSPGYFGKEEGWGLAAGQARSSLGDPMMTKVVIESTCGRVPSTSVWKCL